MRSKVAGAVPVWPSGRRRRSSRVEQTKQRGGAGVGLLEDSRKNASDRMVLCKNH